jgi:hypothetical protein
MNPFLASVMDPFLATPWLVLCAIVGAVIVACVAIVFITDYLRKSQQAALDVYLKQFMLNRDMSATEIKTVLEASSDGEATRLALNPGQGVRVGLGKLQVEVGELRKSASAIPESPAIN